MLARLFLGSCLVTASFCQQSPPDPRSVPAQRQQTLQKPPSQPEEEKLPVPTNKRIFWIIPNYRTYPSLREYKGITVKQKLKIAEQDAFDRGTIVMAAAFAAEGQLTHAPPEFGQGVAGYARYFATSYADLVLGDFMTEAVYPTMLHQDPRFFRRGTGSRLSRLGYAAGQIFWTHRDGGGSQFNFSEIGGNATAVALSNVYYPGSHDASTALSKFALQIGVDMAGNILKEFWPDLDHKFARKHHTGRP